MADPTGISVIFAGLMLLCPYDQSNCASGDADRENVAYVLKADGLTNTCGWYSREKTRLELRFNENDFKAVPKRPADCLADPKNAKLFTCALDDQRICLKLINPAAQTYTADLKSLLRINEIDSRFIQLENGRLNDEEYVAKKIYAPKGTLSAGPLWPKDNNPTRWFSYSEYGFTAPPRKIFSDQLALYYNFKEADSALEINNCDSEVPLARFELLANKQPKIELRNSATELPAPDYDEVGGYDYLTFLLWYYELGSWKTDNEECPQYTKAKRDAVVPRCARIRGRDCANYPFGPRGSVAWPPLLGPPK